MSVNITGLDKVKLLRALWDSSKPASFFRIDGVPPPKWDDRTAERDVKTYIDYHQGRAIKTDLTGDEADPWGYDREYGPGAFQRVAESVRAALTN